MAVVTLRAHATYRYMGKKFVKDVPAEISNSQAEHLELSGAFDIEFSDEPELEVIGTAVENDELAALPHAVEAPAPPPEKKGVFVNGKPLKDERRVEI